MESSGNVVTGKACKPMNFIFKARQINKRMIFSHGQTDEGTFGSASCTFGETKGKPRQLQNLYLESVNFIEEQGGMQAST